MMTLDQRVGAQQRAAEIIRQAGIHASHRSHFHRVPVIYRPTLPHTAAQTIDALAPHW